jgi:hypothetical protein
MPTITKIGPRYGPTSGGTHVTVTGKNFTDVRAVRFGGVDVKFQRVSSTELQATTPAHAAGHVSVAVVTASGRGLARGRFFYAKRATRPVGAGYLVPHAGAISGSLRVVVPRLSCAPHEHSGLGVVLQDVQTLSIGDGWAGILAFKCVDGHARYRAFMRCAGSRGFGFQTYPHAVVAISYGGESVVMNIRDGNRGEAAGCPQGAGPHPYANEPAIAFLVRTASKPPQSLQSLTVHAIVSGAKLADAHPRPQNQRLTSTSRLVPGPIASDGKTFTVRLQHR